MKKQRTGTAPGSISAQGKEPPEESKVTAASSHPPADCRWQSTEQMVGVFFFLLVPVSSSQSCFPSSLPSSSFPSPLPVRDVLMSRKPPLELCLPRSCLGWSMCPDGKGFLQRLTFGSSTGATDFDHLSFVITGPSILTNAVTT